MARIQSAGPVVRLEPACTDSAAEPDPSEKAVVHVEFTHDQFRSLALTTGESVFVKVRDARVFVAGGH